MAPSSLLSARTIAQQVQSGKLSTNDALRLGEEAIEARENRLQVFTAQNPNPAPAEGPLSGISIGVKDVFDTFDMTTSYGSPIYTGHQPVADAALVTMLRQSGATIAGKTVTTEFAWFSPGATRNPHNEEHTPGGSSSGSAAGVAAGYFPAAIGTQTGGSILRPAAFCGVAGYKPSFRLFPTVGLKHFSWSLDTVGFFAATIADAAFVAGACSRRDLEIDPSDQSPVRFGLYQSSQDHLMDAEMASALQTAVAAINSFGGSVTSIKEPGEIENAHHAHAPLQDFEARLALGHERAYHPRLLTPKLRKHLDAADAITPQAYDNARRTANRARKASRHLFADCDVLLMPAAPGAAPKSLESTGDSVFNRLWTLLGVPAVSVPGLRGANGLPLGLQVVAPFGSDKKLLQAAYWLEAALEAR